MTFVRLFNVTFVHVMGGGGGGGGSVMQGSEHPTFVLASPLNFLDDKGIYIAYVGLDSRSNLVLHVILLIFCLLSTNVCYDYIYT